MARHLPLWKACIILAAIFFICSFLTISTGGDISRNQTINTFAGLLPENNINFNANHANHAQIGQLATEELVLATSAPLVNYSFPGLPKTGFLSQKLRRDAVSHLGLIRDFLKGDSKLHERTYPTSPRTDLCDNCFQFNYEPRIVPKVCDGLYRVNVLLLITTVPSATAQRKVIRETWLSESQANMSQVEGISRYVFVVGSGWRPEEQELLEAEAKEWGDIQQDDYLDSYFNLSIKVLSGFHWAHKHCPQAEFIVRTADDNYVNVPNIMLLVQKNKDAYQDVWVGFCLNKAHVFRDIASKFFVSKNEYPGDAYPAYCYGTTFIFSRKMMNNVIAFSPNVPHFVIEDLYFAMVLKELFKYKQKEKIKRVSHFKGFNLSPSKKLSNAVKECPYAKDLMSVHEVPPEVMVNYWKACKDVRLS